MAGSFGTYMAGGQEVCQKWYTAKDINATSASRVAVQADLAIGDIVTLDPHDLPDASTGAFPTGREGFGVGNTVGSILNAATFISQKHYVVVGFHPDVNRLVPGSTTQRQGGVIEVVSRASGVLSRCIGTTDITAGVTALCAKESSGVTVKPSWVAAAAPTTADIAMSTQAKCQETYTTDTTVALKMISLGGYAGTSSH